MDEVNDAEVKKGICPEPNYNVFVSKFYIKVVASSHAEPKIRQITLSRKLGIPVNSQIESENCTIDALRKEGYSWLFNSYLYIGKYTNKNNEQNLIFAKKVEYAGSLFGHNIYKIVQVWIVPLYDGTKFRILNSESGNFQNPESELINFFGKNSQAFFSYDFDVSLSLMRHSKRSFNISENTICRKFNFTYHLSEHPTSDFDIFNIPICLGYFYQIDIPYTNEINKKPIYYTLISRCGRAMAGSRYLSRGVDNNGNVATFVETEQIVSCDHFYVSNIILRGSIPVFWSQNNSKIKPNPTLVGSESDSWSSFTKHFSNLTKSYSESLKIVNLIKNDGREEQLFKIFTKFSNLYISEINNKAEYLHFNFAKENAFYEFKEADELAKKICCSDKEDKSYITSVKIDKLDRSKIDMIKKQNSFLRVNCVDCLDRTGYMQSGISLALLNVLFTTLGNEINLSIDEISPNFHKIRNLWTQMANCLSKFYTGANALKSGFIDSSGSKFIGALQDGKTFLSRFANQFTTDTEKKYTIQSLTNRDFFMEYSKNINVIMSNYIESDSFLFKIISEEMSFFLNISCKLFFSGIFIYESPKGSEIKFILFISVEDSVMYKILNYNGSSSQGYLWFEFNHKNITDAEYSNEKNSIIFNHENRTIEIFQLPETYKCTIANNIEGNFFKDNSIKSLWSTIINSSVKNSPELMTSESFMYSRYNKLADDFDFNL